MAQEKMRVYCETSFWSWLVSRPSTEDAVMDEVYANRREISMRFGNDPKRYIACIRDMKRRVGDNAPCQPKHPNPDGPPGGRPLPIDN